MSPRDLNMYLLKEFAHTAKKEFETESNVGVGDTVEGTVETKDLGASEDSLSMSAGNFF